MSASPLSALQKSGVLPNESKLKELLNGVKTITPIICHLIERGSIDNASAFRNLLENVKALQSMILTHAVASHFEIKPLHYASINRLALAIVCSTSYSENEVDNESIAIWCSELFDMDEIYAESMVDEFTDDQFALQFVAIAQLSNVVTTYLIDVGANEMSDEFFAELMRETIECVDSHIDDIYENFIGPSSSMTIRSHLLMQAGDILGAILKIEAKKSNKSHVNAALINKKFEFAHQSYIEAITLSATMRKD